MMGGGGGGGQGGGDISGKSSEENFRKIRIDFLKGFLLENTQEENNHLFKIRTEDSVWENNNITWEFSIYPSN